MIWKIAWGSVMRHGTRSALIVFAIALSVAAMLFLTAFLDGMRAGFFERMVSLSGHLVVQHRDADGALDPYSLDLLVSEWQQTLDWLRQQDEVVRAEPVLGFGAMVLAGPINTPMIGVGVRPDTGFYSDIRDSIVDGSFLGPDGEPGILISESTAGLLEVAQGTVVAILVEDSTGAPYYLEYPVRGVFSAGGGALGDSTFLIAHAEAQELLYLSGQTREIRVVLESEALAGSVADRLRANGAVPPHAAVLSWRDLNGSLAVLLDLFDVFMYAINLLVVIVAATVIANAILMNIFEKIGEYGTMRAIGLTRRGEFGLVIAEGVSYGIAGAAIGLAVGVPLVLLLERNGIDFGEFMEDFGLQRRLSPQFSVRRAAEASIFGALVAVGGSLYAGIIAMRMSVIESIRGAA